MSVGMQPIFRQTVGPNGVSAVSFNNIPQTFTDLYIVASIRSNTNSIYEPMAFAFNQDTNSFYSNTAFGGTGTSFESSRVGASGYISYNGQLTQNGNTSTSNTFGNLSIYVPNYTSNNFKSMIIDAVTENNSSTSMVGLGAGLWQKTNAITGFKMIPYTGTLLMQHSTISIYGIKKG